MTKVGIGQYDKSVKGRKAVLKQEISFFAEAYRSEKNRKTFPKGTEVIAVHEVVGTGLTTFKFKTPAKNYEFAIREGKYEYIN